MIAQWNTQTGESYIPDESGTLKRHPHSDLTQEELRELLALLDSVEQILAMDVQDLSPEETIRADRLLKAIFGETLD